MVGAFKLDIKTVYENPGKKYVIALKVKISVYNTLIARKAFEI